MKGWGTNSAEIINPGLFQTVLMYQMAINITKPVEYASELSSAQVALFMPIT